MSSPIEHNTAEADHRRYIAALESDTLVKLIVGTDPAQTFQVPRSQVKFGWRECDKCKLPEMLDKAENEMHSANPQNSSGSNAKDGHGKIAAPESSAKALSKAPESSKSKVPEILLPDDDAFTWSAFLRWSNSPSSGLSEATEATALRLVRCWNFGIKYNFKEFADEAMMAMIQMFDSDEVVMGVAPCITTEAIQEAYCSEHVGYSELRRIVAQEMFKNPLLATCRTHGLAHNWGTCNECHADKIKISEVLMCRWPKDRVHRCGLVDDLWKDTMDIKKGILVDGGLRRSMYERLVTQDGKPPSYMSFFVSTKWRDVLSSIL